MNVVWDVDEATTVEADYKAFGKEIVRVNGRDALSRRSLSYKARTTFELADGRKAMLSARARLFLAPEILLHVNGELCTPRGDGPIACSSCGAAVRSFDRFCDGCGKPLATAETREHEKHVRDATRVLFWIGGMFAVFGSLFFYIEQRKAEDADAQLEAWGLLIGNGVLALTMVLLGLWGRRAPLPAMLVASAVYATVEIGNAIVDPRSIMQGLLMKGIVIVLLARGIKAALALRAAEAADRAA